MLYYHFNTFIIFMEISRHQQGISFHRIFPERQWMCKRRSFHSFFNFLRHNHVTRERIFLSLLWRIFQWLGLQSRGTFYERFCHRNSLRWRHNERHGVSNHQPHYCLLRRLFRRRSKKTSKLRVTGLCEGNPPVIDEFPAQRPVTQKMFAFDDVIMSNSMEHWF